MNLKNLQKQTVLQWIGNPKFCTLSIAIDFAKTQEKDSNIKKNYQQYLEELWSEIISRPDFNHDKAFQKVKELKSHKIFDKFYERNDLSMSELVIFLHQGDYFESWNVIPKRPDAKNYFEQLPVNEIFQCIISAMAYHDEELFLEFILSLEKIKNYISNLNIVNFKNILIEFENNNESISSLREALFVGILKHNDSIPPKDLLEYAKEVFFPEPDVNGNPIEKLLKRESVVEYLNDLTIHEIINLGKLFNDYEYLWPIIVGRKDVENYINNLSISEALIFSKDMDDASVDKIIFTRVDMINYLHGLSEEEGVNLIKVMYDGIPENSTPWMLENILFLSKKFPIKDALSARLRDSGFLKEIIRERNISIKDLFLIALELDLKGHDGYYLWEIILLSGETISPKDSLIYGDEYHLLESVLRRPDVIRYLKK